MLNSTEGELLLAEIRASGAAGIPADARIEEIGNGNINRVYRISGGHAARSVIVKLARYETNISPEIRLDPARGAREAAYFTLFGDVVPGLLPALYGYDAERRLLFMEDIGGCAVLRDALLRGDDVEKNLAAVADGVVRMYFHTRRLLREPAARERLRAGFGWNDLCGLTEALVFTQPYGEHPNNGVSPANRGYVRDRVYENAALRAAVDALRERFRMQGQTVIHGDLHTGSVFVSPERTVLFDAEFSYFGPLGYDIGNVLAHLCIACCRKMTEKDAPSAQRIAGYAAGFLDRLSARFSEAARAAGLESAETAALLRETLADSAGYAGTECLRRVIGLAKTPELTEPAGRAETERAVLEAGVRLVLEPAAFITGGDYRRLLLV